MQAYAELLPPTAVTHAVSLPFLQSQDLDLVVAKTSLLQIFQLRDARADQSGHDTYGATNGATQDLKSHTQQGTSKKLYLVAEYPLSGTITSLARIKLLDSKTGGEALLISFRDAKASLVEWNPESHGLSTISVHYYENEELLGSPWAPDLEECSSYLLADPSSRCAALKFGQRHLAILPFKQPSDDLTMEDYDPAIDEAPASNKAAEASTVEGGTPYESSFVLQLTELDPSVIHVEHLAFLYEYREPTLGVLAASKSPSYAIALDRKDIYTYTAFTLDLQQRASTALISVTSLPSDLFQVVPLPLPVGGSLLVGGNEIIHVDQAGKTHGVGVNDFAKQASDFPMTDRSSLALRLEGSSVVQVSNNGDVLLALNTGEFILVRFQIDGRSVSGFTVSKVPTDKGGHILGAAASCACPLGSDVIFVGSEEADSLLVHCKQRRSTLSRKRSHAEMLGVSVDAESDEDMSAEDEDDLYGDGPALQRVQSHSAMAVEDATYIVLDRLPNLSACGEPVFGRRRDGRTGEGDSAVPGPGQLELAMATGTGAGGAVAFMNRDVVLDGVRDLDLENASRVWTLSTAKPESAADEGELEPQNAVTDLVVTSTHDGRSNIYRVSDGGLEVPSESSFESEVATLDAGSICRGKRIVQVSPSEVRCYPKDLSFPQIFPVSDESSDAEDEDEGSHKVMHSCILDPYVLVIRQNGTCLFLKASDKGELDEIDTGDLARNTQWASASLYSHDGGESHSTLAFLLSVEGALHVFELPDLDKPAYSVENIGQLPQTLAAELTQRRTANRERLDELLVVDMGTTEVHSPYLVLRTESNSIVMYRPYHYPSKSETSFTQNLRWTKVQEIPGNGPMREVGGEYELDQRPMRPLRDAGGYNAVYLPASQSLLFQEPASTAYAVRIHGAEDVDLASFSGIGCPSSLLRVDGQGKARLVSLPSETQYSQGWSVRRTPQHQQIDALAYHDTSDLYVACINAPVGFTLPEDDDWHPDWSKEDIAFKPLLAAGRLRLLDGKTSSVLHETTIEPDETILTAKTLTLETSEHTHEKRRLIVIGTAIMRGEDQPSNGAIYVYDIISVAPDPDRSGSGRALKLIAREEVKGAVTAISEIGDDGFMLAAQGQKLMVRGLKEDGTVLPVAFLDVQIMVTSLKSIPGTGVALCADAMMGVWVVGYAPDPYRMKLLGKTRSALQVVAADMLPYEGQLFGTVIDTDSNLHVFEYNAEDPKSLSGQRLLNRSSFHTGHSAIAMLTLPTTPTSTRNARSSSSSRNGLTNGDTHMTDSDTSTTSATPPYQTLITTQSGSLALLTPLSEETYRRLGALQNYLNSILEQHCGLNPRAYRAVDTVGGIEGTGGRGVIDGEVLRRWSMLGAQRKGEACARAGTDRVGLGRELALLRGGELGMF